MNLNDFTRTTEIPIKPNGKVRTKSRQTKPFLRGPVPMDWLYAAGSLPGRCLHVGIVLWHEAGMIGCQTVKFRPSKALKFGMHRDTARRALKRLQKAGLIVVHQRPGQCLEIQILDVNQSGASYALAGKESPVMLAHHHADMVSSRACRWQNPSPVLTEE